MENEAQKSAGKVWLIPTIVAAVLLIGLIVFMVIMGKGTSAVADGTVTLAESVAPLKDGTAQLSDGVDQYTEGVDQVADGIELLNDNVPTLADGVQQLADGAVALNKGVNVGSGSLAAGVKTLHDSGIQLADGLIGMLDTLAANTDKYVADATTAAGVQYDLTNDADGINGPACKAAQGNVAAAVANTGGSLATYTAVMDNTGLTAARKFVEENPQYQALLPEAIALCSVASGAIAMNDTNTAYVVNGNVITTTISSQKNAIIYLMAQSQGISPEAAMQNPGFDAMVEQTISDISTKLTKTLTAYVNNVNANGITNPTTGKKMMVMQDYQTASGSVTPAVTALCNFYGSHGAAQALATVRNSMISGGITYDSMNFMKKGLKDLQNGVNGKDGLAEGVKKLQAGTAQLNAGVPTLSDGIKQLFDGTQKLKDNSGALRDGASQLKDAAPALIDGIQQLVDGAKKVQGFVPGNK